MVVDSIKIKESNLSVKKLYKTRVMTKWNQIIDMK
jgi:hypothetical protein